MKTHETIIIGGGIAGLACGRTLATRGHDVLLITKRLGGRMRIDRTGAVNYGASYMTTEYRAVGPFLEKGEELRIRDSYFRHDNKFTNLLSALDWNTWPKILRLCLTLYDFRWRIRRLRNRCLRMQQKDALALDPVLSAHVATPAKRFIKARGLEKLNRDFIDPLFNSTMFTPSSRSDTFYYLAILAPLICKTWRIDLRQTVPRLTEGWQNKIRLASVRSVQQTRDGIFVIRSDAGTFQARNVVLALPYPDARRIHAVPKPRRIMPAYTIHIKGKRREEYQGMPIIFFRPTDGPVAILWRQNDGTDIIFSTRGNPPLSKYYVHHTIVGEVYWPTAIIMPGGKKWLPQVIGKNIYVAGDYNFCGLEDSFITGVYAANRILGIAR